MRNDLLVWLNPSRSGLALVRLGAILRDGWAFHGSAYGRTGCCKSDWTCTQRVSGVPYRSPKERKRKFRPTQKIYPIMPNMNISNGGTDRRGDTVAR